MPSSEHHPTDSRDARFRFLRAGVATAIVDGLFSSVLNVAAYGSTVSRLFQGVAATLIGNSAFTGGARTTALGVLMHCGVAFAWSAVFVFVVMRSAWIRRLLAARYGVVRVASVYGPAIWMMMSLVVIPVLLERPPSIAFRWWVQFFGHVPFVGLPIVALGSSSARRD
jgi:hypothetical protein